MSFVVSRAVRWEWCWGGRLRCSCCCNVAPPPAPFFSLVGFSFSVLGSTKASRSPLLLSPIGAAGLYVGSWPFDFDASQRNQSILHRRVIRGKQTHRRGSGLCRRIVNLLWGSLLILVEPVHGAFHCIESINVTGSQLVW